MSPSYTCKEVTLVHVECNALVQIPTDVNMDE